MILVNVGFKGGGNLIFHSIFRGIILGFFVFIIYCEGENMFEKVKSKILKNKNMFEKVKSKISKNKNIFEKIKSKSRIFKKPKNDIPLQLPPERYIVRDVDVAEKVMEDFAEWLAKNHSYRMELIKENPNYLFVLMREYCIHCTNKRFEKFIEWGR